MLAILCLIILPAGYLDAQNVLTNRDLGRISQEMHGSGIITFRSTKYIGSPYLTKFQQGYVTLKGNKKSELLLLRYNEWKNNVQFLRDKKIYMIPAKKLSGFIIKTTDGNMTFKNGFKTDQKHINQNTLLWVIYNGNIKLLAYFASTLQKNIVTYGTATKKNKFVNHTYYYLRTPNGTFHNVKLKKKDILHALPDHKKDVKSYAKKNHLGFKSKKDLQKILAYYDHIQKNSD
jgi:hypothetical protein